MSRSVTPVMGNLAWAPLAALDEVDILDRFNGVPTIGVVRGAGASHLFWRVTGYVPEHVSCWIYVPLSAEAEKALDDEDPLALLLNRPARLRLNRPVSDIYVTVGVAWDNRLIFEREWSLPAEIPTLEALVRAYLTYVSEAMHIMTTQDLPPTRRENFERASRAVRELVDC